MGGEEEKEEKKTWERRGVKTEEGGRWEQTGRRRRKDEDIMSDGEREDRRIKNRRWSERTRAVGGEKQSCGQIYVSRWRLLKVKTASVGGRGSVCLSCESWK